MIWLYDINNLLWVFTKITNYTKLLDVVYLSYVDGANCTVKKAIHKATREMFAAKICQTNFLSAKN